MIKINIILHIPHASTNIPFRDVYLIRKGLLEKEILKLADWYTDDLFQCDNTIIVQADFSRIFCDMERFADDKKETMAQFGMGVLYEKTDSGRHLEESSNKKLKNFDEIKKVVMGFIEIIWTQFKNLTK